MIKLKQLLEEGYISKAWWMDKNGTLFPVPLQNHSDFAKQKLGINPSEKVYEQDIYKRMYSLGWLRITYFGMGGVYYVTFNTNEGTNLNPLQEEAIFNLAKQYDANEIMDLANRRRFPVNDF